MNEIRKGKTLAARAARRRSEQTPAEVRLWEKLRATRLLGLHFKRQHQKNNQIVDFYCADLKVAVDIRPDGLKWAFADHVAALEAVDVVTLRFSESEVLGDIERVVRIIAGACKRQLRRRSCSGYASVPDVETPAVEFRVAPEASRWKLALRRPLWTRIRVGLRQAVAGLRARAALRADRAGERLGGAVSGEGRPPMVPGAGPMRGATEHSDRPTYPAVGPPTPIAAV